MKLYSGNKDYKLYHGNMLDMLEVIEKESIDSIITDPPYGLTSITKRFGKENSAECQYGKAVMYENKERNKNYKYIGIEITEEYLPISKARIDYVCNMKLEINPQIDIFELLKNEGE